MDEERELAEQRVGAILRGKWTLERVIGIGGMAAVYEARHTIGRRDAIKILHPEFVSDPTLRRRFEQEARATNRFDHPGAVEVRDMDVAEDGSPFLVMELLRGGSLREKVRDQNGLSRDELLGYVDELLDVLAAAHARGIVHRDIKLDNLFVTEDGLLKVLDFGIARIGADAHRIKLTSQGTTIGTVAYMPPEQVRGRDIDGRADLFAVGALMFRVLARRHIHPAPSEPERLLKMATEPAPPLATVIDGADEDLCLVVDRALQFNQSQRYPDATTMQSDVRELRSGRRPPNASKPGAPTSSAPIAEAGAPATRVEGSTPSEQDTSQLTGMLLGGCYRLERLVGRGGMGAVYEAVTPHGDRVAVKVLGQEWMSKRKDARVRFQREARTAAEIHSKHVVRVIDADADEQAGFPFIVMELLEGLDMEQLLAEHSPLEPQAAVRLFVQACQGVAAAHARGIVHRDIKPANLLLHRQDGEVIVKVCDFGLAKLVDDAATTLTKTGGVLGTLLYSSPEQAKNAKHVDARADVWSLSMSLHEALSGQRPWAHCEAQGELVLAICTEQVPRLEELAPWLDKKLCQTIHRGLSRDLDARWQDAAELMTVLEPFCGGQHTVPEDSLERCLSAPTAPAVRARDGYEGRSLAAVEDEIAPPKQRRRLTLAMAFAALAIGGLISFLTMRPSLTTNEASGPPGSAAELATTSPTTTSAGPAPTGTSSSLASAPTARGSSSQPAATRFGAATNSSAQPAASPTTTASKPITKSARPATVSTPTALPIRKSWGR